MFMQLHGEVPVANSTACVIAGAQVLPDPQVPELLDLEDPWIRVLPEPEDGLELVPFPELGGEEKESEQVTGVF